MSELNKAEKYLLENLTKLAKEGCIDENPRPVYKSDETPANSIFITSVYETYDLSKGEFPITETRPIAIKSGIGEVFWIYQDQSNDLNLLKDKYNVDWWDSWDIGNRTIGQRYGATVKEYDLMNKLLYGLKNDPFGRRHIISLWQEEDFKKEGKLPPCAFQTMYSVRKVDGQYYLDLTLTQRSNDYLVSGTGINQMQYIAKQMSIAKHCSFKVGKFSHLRQNLHIYSRHIEQAEETINRIKQLKERDIQSQPKLILNVPDGTNFYDITVDDFELVDYNPIRPQLKFDLAI